MPSTLTKVLLAFLFCEVAFSQRIDLQSARMSPSSMEGLPFLDLSTISKAHQSLSIQPEEAERARRYDWPRAVPLYNQNDPSQSGKVHTYKHVLHSGGHESLPFESSDIVVYGQVISETPHISQSGTTVYSTFGFVPSKVLKGYAHVGEALSLERAGGIVLFPSGKREFIGVLGQSLPIQGHSYLLFLKTTSDGFYQILAGFSLEGSHPVALDQEDVSIERQASGSLIQTIETKLSAKN